MSYESGQKNLINPKTKKMKIKLISAIGLDSSIGTATNTIPWGFNPEDMKIFSKKTKSEGGIVIMGRKTYESLPEQYKPLTDRRNIVITKHEGRYPDDVEVYNTPDQALSALENMQTLWVIGGGSIYSYFFEMADELHISHFNITPEHSAVFFPKISKDSWSMVESVEYPATNNSPSFTHTVYTRKI